MYKCVLLALAWLAGAWAACPSSGDITPCTCREETAGRIMECSSISSSSQLVNVFSHDLADPTFQYFQIVKLSGRCTLEKVPANVFGSSTFMFVWFGQTDVVTVDSAAFEGNEITMLELTFADANKMTTYPFESLGDLQSLYKFFVSNSLIDTITHFGPAPNLTQVSVTGSKVSTITPGAFADLGRLSRLDLHDNPLTSLQDGWFTSSSSEPWVLYLDDCSISDISPGAFSGSLPAGIYLAGNSLTAIPEATFLPLLENMEAAAAAGQLTHYIDFDGNRLVCDCGVEWLATSTTLLPFVRNAVCSNGDVSGTDIADLPADFFASC
nr:oplophorus-luciferin 2-monooxygenase non-catalytic subunit-like [Procambarus clarkii]